LIHFVAMVYIREAGLSHHCGDWPFSWQTWCNWCFQDWSRREAFAI